MRAWDGKQFKDIDPHAEKHVGEDEAMAVMMWGAKPDTLTAADQSEPQMRMLKGIPFLDGRPFSGIIPAAASDGKIGGVAAAIGAIGAGPRPSPRPNISLPSPQRPLPQPALSPRWQPPIPGSGTPPASLGIRAKPPYERTPQDLSEAPMPTGRPTPAPNAPGIDLPSQMPGNRGAAEQDWTEAAKWNGWPLNTLPRANHQRTPESVVHGVLLDEGLSTRLSELKKEWASLEKENPEVIAGEKEDAARQLVVMASDELFAFQGHPPSDKQDAEMMRTALELVNRPYRDGEEFRNFPEFRKLPPKPTIDELAKYIEQSLSERIVEEERSGGRPGSLQTRRDIERISGKLAEALKQCGAVIRDNRFADSERQIRQSPDTALGSRYPDIEVEFELENGGSYSLGDIFSLYVSHFSHLKDGTMNSREAGQFMGLEENIRKELVKAPPKPFRTYALEAIRKRGKNETDDDYFKMVDKWVKKIIDCGKIGFVNIKIKKGAAKMKPASGTSSGN